MKIITIQSKDIIPIINKDGIYKSNIISEHDNKYNAYKQMMDYYKYDSNPIFGCLVGSNRFSFCGSPVLEENYDCIVILELDIPDEYVKIQDYYNWTDTIYYNEFVDEIPDHMDLGLYMKDADITDTYTSEYNREVQVTIPYIKKEWISNIIEDVKDNDYTNYLLEVEAQAYFSVNNLNLKSISDILK